MRSETDAEVLGRVLNVCNQVDPVSPGTTHSADCWRWHGPCLAEHVRQLILEGGN
jgi:hypothetical protein